jgi:hypothetical protein
MEGIVAGSAIFSGSPVSGQSWWWEGLETRHGRRVEKYWDTIEYIVDLHDTR